MVRLQTTKIGLFPLDKLKRTKAFEHDLDFYLGKGWMKNYSPRYSLYIKLYIYTLYVGMCMRRVESAECSSLIKSNDFVICATVLIKGV